MSSARCYDVRQFLASETQASQGRREGAYLEGTCPTENAARRRGFAGKTAEMLWDGPLCMAPVSATGSDRSTTMPTTTPDRTTTTVRTIEFDEALGLVESGAAFLDVREIDAYLDVHIPGSIAVLYEFGPGFNSRARDCIPLEVPLVLLDLGHGDLVNAASALRGKGFDVVGKVEDGINRWAAKRGHPASTEVVTDRPDNVAVLHVNDPGARPIEPDLTIPIERLWAGVDGIASERVAIAAGFGVRAAIAVGILERAGHDVVFWKTRA